MPLSREVQIATIFSTRTSSPSATSSEIVCAAHRSVVSTLRGGDTDRSLTHTFVRAASAMLTPESLVRTSSRTVASSTASARTWSRWSVSSELYRSTLRFSTVPSSADSMSTGAEKFSATKVVSRARRCASAKLTKRRSVIDSMRPCPSRSRLRRVSVARRRSITRWCSSTSAESGVTQSPPSMRNLSTSQFGALTMLSLTTSRPDTSVVSRLNTPARYVPG